MPISPPTFRPRVAAHVLAERQAREREYDRRRDESIPTRRFYRTKAWRQRRAAQLAAEPLCWKCAERGIDRPASIADHDPPHRGNVWKFWNGPLKSLCKQCHDRDKQAEERAFTCTPF